MDRSNGKWVWISLGLQAITLISAIFVYITALPTKSDLQKEVVTLRSEIQTLRDNIREDFRLLHSDIDKLNQNYIDHLAYHVSDEP